MHALKLPDMPIYITGTLVLSGFCAFWVQVGGKKVALGIPVCYVAV